MHIKWAKLQGVFPAGIPGLWMQAGNPWSNRLCHPDRCYERPPTSCCTPFSTYIYNHIFASTAFCVCLGVYLRILKSQKTELLKLDTASVLLAGSRWSWGSWGPSVQNCLRSSIDLSIFWLNMPGEVLQPQGRLNSYKQCWHSIVSQVLSSQLQSYPFLCFHIKHSS